MANGGASLGGETSSGGATTAGGEAGAGGVAAASGGTGSGGATVVAEGGSSAAGGTSASGGSTAQGLGGSAGVLALGGAEAQGGSTEVTGNGGATTSETGGTAGLGGTGGVTATGGGLTVPPDDAASTSSTLVALDIPDRSIVYGVEEPGVSKAIPRWGLDTAWVSEANIRRGIAFMGAERVDVVRVSFTPTAALVDGALQSEQAALLEQRLDYVDLVGAHAAVVLNADPPSIDPWFTDGSGNVVPARLATLIDVTAARCQERGRTVLAAAPLNEPDYDTKQGTIETFYDVAGELALLPRFDAISITGGNTLNADQASVWYDALKERLDEGNTHQLSGSFDSYAGFFQSVVANGDRAVNDELHNVVESIVGAEYGVQTGIWWGTAEYARGEFVKASDGMRLGYAEHRPNWTAAAIYRTPEGRVQAFGGGSERQATTTVYRFVSRDRDVFYDGYGPQREYLLEIPGGTGYWENQPNAERVVDVTWGDDIQHPVNGRYVLVNQNSEKVLEVAGGATTDGANIQQGEYSGGDHQKWDVVPVEPRVGQDFSYFGLTAVHSGSSPDVLDFSLENGGNVIQWPSTLAANQQWFLVYARDGWFHICSRQSAKCLDVMDESVAAGANVQQWERTDRPSQKWRLLPDGAALEFIAPSPPTALRAFANPASVLLDWTASVDTDVSGYAVLRSTSTGGPYQTIARGLATTSFVDNTAAVGVTHHYVVFAEDGSRNRSAHSGEVAATSSGVPTLVMHLPMDGDTKDTSVNLNHAATHGAVTYTTGKLGSQALSLNGADTFVQLPPVVANHESLTIAAWVNWSGGESWQRIFDFGVGEAQSIFLTPASGTGVLRFVVNDGTREVGLEAPALTIGAWTHVAIMIDSSSAQMYVNGALVAETMQILSSPAVIQPCLNYLGRSQFNDPLFQGSIDDFRIYNYALPEDELAGLVAAGTE